MEHEKSLLEAHRQMEREGRKTLAAHGLASRGGGALSSLHPNTPGQPTGDGTANDRWKAAEELVQHGLGMRFAVDGDELAELRAQVGCLTGGEVT